MSWGRRAWGSHAWGATGTEGQEQLSEDLSEVRSLLAAYSVGTGAQPREMTRAHTTTEYGSSYVVGSLGSGFSFIESVGNISSTPDLAASIAVALYIKDLPTTITGLEFADLPTTIFAGFLGNFDLPTTITSLTWEDFGASISTIVANLGATINSPAPADLPGVVNSIAPKNLPAFIGGHFPVDLLAIIFGVTPSDISGNIRGFLMGTPSDLATSITSTGEYSGILASMRVTSSTFVNLGATLTVREPVDFSAYILGQRVFDLTASISHNYAAPDFRALIKPYKSVTSNIAGWVKSTRQGILNMGGYTRTVTSTHTGPKTRNIGKFPRNFPDNKYIIGTYGAGLTFLTIEPIFSFFPDLQAFITGLPFNKSNIAGYIWAFIPDSLDTPTSIVGVTPQININRVKLNYVLFKTLKGVLSPSGGYLNLKSIIRGLKSESTGTSNDAAYTYVQNTTAQFLATSIGLLILPPVTSELKRGTYVNNHPRPDLNAYLYGWATLDLQTSIRAYPQLDLPTSVMVWDLSHIYDFPGAIQSLTTSSIQASITSSGGYSDLPTTVTSLLYTEDLQTLINGYPAVLGREIVTVHTKPFSDFAVSINFDTRFSCSILSGYYGMNAFIVGTASSTEDMPTAITALHNSEDISGFITGLKRIQLKILELYFRTNIRDSAGLTTTIRAWAGEVPNDLPASIVGLHHTSDLSAAIEARRFKPARVTTADDIEIVNLNNPDERTTAEILFASGVDKYIYDSNTLELYSEDYTQSWSVIVRDTDTQDGFFDRAINVKSKVVAEVTDYDSFDEAIRETISILINGYPEDIGASLTVSGGFSSLTASVAVSTLDRVSDFGARIFEVATIPDLNTYISAAGYFASIDSSIKSIEKTDESLSVSLVGWAESNLSCEISGSF